jgi:hypothetical protein
MLTGMIILFRDIIMILAKGIDVLLLVDVFLIICGSHIKEIEMNIQSLKK